MTEPIALINPESPQSIVDGLKKIGIHPFKVPLCSLVAPPLKGHPDLQMFLYNNTFFFHWDIDRKFVRILEPYGEVHICSTILTPQYPGDIPFNVANTGAFAFHRVPYCDSSVKEYLVKNGIRLIDVQQGYSKCSTLIVDPTHIITADSSIHNAALNVEVKSLLITAGHIVLPGYAYGFIGGATGFFDDSIFFTGTLKNHPDRIRMLEFIEQCGKNPVFLSHEPLIDLGSLFIL